MKINLINSDTIKANYKLTVKTKTENCVLEEIRQDGNKIIWDFCGLTVTDSISEKENTITLKRRIFSNKEDFFSINFTVFHNCRDCELFMPGVMYQKNTKGKGKYPRITEQHSSWSFDETRCSIPGCMALYNKSEIMIAAHRTDEIKISSSFDELSFSFRLPSEEWPYVYSSKDTLRYSMDKKDSTFVHMKKNQVIFQEYLIYHSDMNDLNLFDHYKRYVEIFRPLNDEHIDLVKLHNFKALLLSQLLSLLEHTDSGSYLKMGRGNGKNQDVYEFTSASFLVKSVEAAVIFNRLNVDSLKENIDSNILEILNESERKNLNGRSYDDVARDIGDFFLQAETQKGIFQDCYDINKNIWAGYLGVGENEKFNYGINARTNGEAMMAYLELYNNCNFNEKNRYLDLINSVADFYITHQEENGNYGRWWNINGSIMDDFGTNGAYILSFLSKLYKTTKNDVLLKSINRAIPYYSDIIKRFDFYADTLDADSCDKEAGIALLMAFINIYQLDPQKQYLRLCEICANYIITWIQIDDIKFDSKSPLGRRGFKTRGMSSVSIANQHLDFYGMLIAYNFLYLHKFTNKKFYKKIASIMIDSCTQLISSPTDSLGRGDDFFGWIPEQINHTNWDYFNNKENTNGTFSINIAWVQVLVLDYLDKIEVLFGEELKNEI